MPADTPRSSEAQAVLDAVGPRLEAMGVAHVEVVVRGTRNMPKFWVGYRLAPGVARSHKEIDEVVTLQWPASVSYAQLRVVPESELPSEDVEMAAAISKMQRPKLVGLLAIVSLSVALVLALTVFNRGSLVATATLHAAGSAEARFTSSGKPLTLWASLDGSYTGTSSSKTLRKILPVHYEVDFEQDGKLLRHESIDTQVTRGVQKLHCTFGNDCEVYLMDLPALPAGAVLMRVQGKPRADVVSVGDMSLNLREDTVF